MNINSFCFGLITNKLLKPILLISLLVLSFNLKCQTNEVEYNFGIYINGEYPVEAILEAKILYQNDLEKLNFVLDQIKLFEKMGVHILSSRQFEAIKQKRDSLSKNSSNESQIAEIKRILSYLNDTFKPVTAIN